MSPEYRRLDLKMTAKLLLFEASKQSSFNMGLALGPWDRLATVSPRIEAFKDSCSKICFNLRRGRDIWLSQWIHMLIAGARQPRCSRRSESEQAELKTEFGVYRVSLDDPLRIPHDLRRFSTIEMTLTRRTNDRERRWSSPDR